MNSEEVNRILRDMDYSAGDAIAADDDMGHVIVSAPPFSPGYPRRRLHLSPDETEHEVRAELARFLS